MSDTDSPEELKPFRPDPSKNPFDRPPIEPRAFTEPDPNYDPDSPDIALPNDQEKLFRIAAIKCAEMEDELAGLLSIYPKGITKLPRTEQDLEFQVERTYQQTFLTLETEELKGVASGKRLRNALIRFKILGYQPYNDVATNYELEIYGVHTDEATLGKFEELSDGGASSKFYFSHDGNTGKVIEVPKELELDYAVLRDTKFPKLDAIASEHQNRYEVNMGNGDFEVAGRALQILTEKLKPQEQPEMDSGSSPE